MKYALLKNECAITYINMLTNSKHNETLLLNLVNIILTVNTTIFNCIRLHNTLGKRAFKIGLLKQITRDFDTLWTFSFTKI